MIRDQFMITKHRARISAIMARQVITDDRAGDDPPGLP